jgi:hypothetical protein
MGVMMSALHARVRGRTERRGLPPAGKWETCCGLATEKDSDSGSSFDAHPDSDVGVVRPYDPS